MAASKQMETEFKVGDIVQMKDLKSKVGWNGKLATIIGEKRKEKNRWPIQINFGNKSKALLQTQNLELHERPKNANVNVVEIQSNRGDYIGPLGNRLRNISFDKRILSKYIKNRWLREYKSPLLNY